MTNKQELLNMIDDIKGLIESSEDADGNLCFDVLRAKAAIHFARMEIEKSIQNKMTHKD